MQATPQLPEALEVHATQATPVPRVVALVRHPMNTTSHPQIMCVYTNMCAHAHPHAELTQNLTHKPAFPGAGGTAVKPSSMAC